MKKLNKRALATIVATVLIILLTMSAVAVLVKFLVPFVKNNLQKSSECIEFSQVLSFKDKFETQTGSLAFTCYQRSGSNYYIGTMIESLGDTSEAKLRGFKIVYYDGTSSVSVEVNRTSPSSSGPNGIKVMGELVWGNLIVPAKEELVGYVFHTDRAYNKAEVYPILNSGRLCEKSDSINIPLCKSNVDLTTA